MIHPSIEAKNTGVTLKSHLTKSTHVRQTCRVTFFHLSRINKIRRYMDNQSVKWVVNAVVLSRLDYCNSLLVGLAGDLLKRLHHVQNSAARTILDLKRLEPVRRHLNSLCWLPITELKVSLHPVTWPAIGRQESPQNETIPTHSVIKESLFLCCPLNMELTPRHCPSSSHKYSFPSRVYQYHEHFARTYSG